MAASKRGGLGSSPLTDESAAQAGRVRVGAFASDPGPAPSSSSDAPPDDQAADQAPAGGGPFDQVGEQQPAEQPVAATDVQAAGLVLDAVWGCSHELALAAGGPPDAFQPSAGMRDAQARALAAIAQRYAVAGVVVSQGSTLAAAMTIGLYAVAETRRTAQYRAANAPAEQGEPVIPMREQPAPAAPAQPQAPAPVPPASVTPEGIPGSWLTPPPVGR